MDRVNQLRGDGAGGSRDSSLDGSGAGDSFLTANDTPSKYYSLSEDDSFDISKDVSLASTSSETTLNESECFSNLSPIGKNDLLDYKIGKQIEAANILSGGVNIFDDNESSYDGNELVIDDNVEIDKSTNLKSPDSGLPLTDNVEIDQASTSKSLGNPGISVNVETEDKSIKRPVPVQDVAIGQSSSLKAPQAGLPLDKEQLLENIEAVEATPPFNQGRTSHPVSEPIDNHSLLDNVAEVPEVNLPIDNSIGDVTHPENDVADMAEIALPENGNGVEELALPEGVADVAEIALPENGVADLAEIALPENGVADVAEIALPLEEAEIGEANLPNDIGEANLPNDNVEEHSDNVAEETDDRTEVVLQIDGNNVAAISIGTGLYLYRKEGQEELAAVQIVEGEESSFKFLKVRENAEGNLEVYEEIQEVVVVPQEMPVREVRPTAAVTVTASTSREHNRPVVCEPSSSPEVVKKDSTPDDAAVPSTSKQDNEPNKDQGEPKNGNLNGKMVKISEARKSPLMAYHSTPNKEGIPLTKTMVDQQLHPNRLSDNIKKTIEVHTDHCKQKTIETPSTSKCKDYVSPDKKSDELSVIDKTIDKDISDKKQMNIVIKETVAVSIEETQHTEKKTEEMPCSSTDANKAEAAKPHEGNAKVVMIDKEKEIEKAIIVSEEKKKKAESDDISMKSAEVPSTSSYASMLATGISKENKVEGKQLLTSMEPIMAVNKALKDSRISTSLPLIVAPMESDTTVTKIPEIEKVCEKTIDTHTEIIESDDMEVDEDVLVIEEQIIESQCEENEVKKIDEKNSNLAVENKTKVIDDQIKNVLGTGDSKPTSSVNSNTRIFGTRNISNLSKIDINPVKDINVISNSNKSRDENKSESGINMSSFNNEEGKGTKSKDTQLNHTIKTVGKDLTEESTVPRESLDLNMGQPKVNESREVKPVGKSSAECKPDAVEHVIPTAKVNHTINNIHDKSEKNISKLESTDKNIDKISELPLTNTRDVKASTVLPFIEHRHTGLPNNAQHLIKPYVKSDIKPSITNASETKKELNHKLPVNAVDIKPKSINNNHAPVPFGKWTEANRQEFLNKFKESKPVNISNANQIKQPNDLNRRDVLKKIDSQRQTYNANVKIQESLNKGNVKTEAFASKTVPATITKRESKVPVKSEAPVLKPKPVLENKLVRDPIQVTPVETTVSVVTATPSGTNKELPRKGINNQQIIDKTVEGIINRVLTGKGSEDVKQAVTERKNIEKVDKKAEQKPNSQPTLLDAIEMKMNELHGIPFVERPPHELPRSFVSEPKASSETETDNIPQKVSKIPNLLPLTKSQQKLKDCEDDIINLESRKEKSTFSSKPAEKALAKNTAAPEPNASQDKIITEMDFDKFARRNSVTYEDCLTVTDSNQVIQTVVPREPPPKKISRNEQMLAEAKAKSPHKHLPVKQYPSKAASKYIPADKQYQSKLQLAYHTAMTKRRIDSPITIIEDKPVKVVYLDSNVSEFTSSQLNVQGRDLSPAKRPIEPDAVTVGTCDSLDSDILDAIEDIRQDEVKTKSKHQRKQVLTPVETPDLELIEPGDLGFEVSPKKKRKTEDRAERKQNLVPKKSYLLGRSVTPADLDVPRENRLNPVPTVVHTDAVSAIDNLVKAAELLENQSEIINASVQSLDSSQNTPVKRGRGRPRKNPLPDVPADNTVSPQKKPRLIDAKPKHISSSDEDSSDDDSMIKENWTMGKINDKIVCPICNKLFRSENVVFKHVKHCTGPSPSRSDSGKRSPRRSRLSRESETKSRESETKSRRSGSNDPDEVDLSPIRKTPKKRKSKDSGKSSSSNDVIPVETDFKESENSDLPAKMESRKTLRPKLNPKTNNLVCEICGKSFRQLSYLVSHRLQHKKEENKKNNEPQTAEKSVFSCETCKKEFRKLHHLVQHRLIHNPVQSRALRKTSSEQKELPKSQDAKLEDQSAGFRCEPCDKSFRKLHHLVEHRETHDGINRQRSNSITQVAEKEKSTPPPQCEICKKTFRKLHHLIEHKEQHLETSSEKSDDQKSVKSSLSTKDIIHECNLCYMVFPNEHSLNKHTVICLRKKKQSAAKKAAAQEDKSAEDDATTELPEESKTEAVKEAEPAETKLEEKVEILPEKPLDPPKPEIPQIKDDLPKQETVAPVEKEQKQELKEVENNPPLPENPIPKVKPAEAAIKKLVEEIIVIEDTPVKKKAPIKDKVAPSVTKRQKIAPSTEELTVPSSDDDEIRYMFNPDFKAFETSESKTFTKIRAKKRNSLQFERSQKDVVRRRSLLQHPPKIPRVRAKSDDVVPQKPVMKPKEEVLSTDSDDSDVKYSFPPAPVKKETSQTEPTRRKTMAEKQEVPETEPKRRKTMAEKRKSLSGIAKRKSLGKAIVKSAAKTLAEKTIKRRTAAAEHRCDCGQLFSSAALLARHASLAHTPPRVRRPRDADATPSVGRTKKCVGTTRKSVDTTRKSVDTTRKSVDTKRKSVDTTTKSVEARKSVDQPKKSVATLTDTAGKSKRKSSVEQSRKSVAPKRNSVDQSKSVAKDSKSSVERKSAVGAKDSARKAAKTPSSRNRVHTGVPLPEKRPSRK